MKPKFTLFAKILLWFLLNAVVLTVLLLSLFNLRVRLDPDSPLKSLSGGGLRSVALPIVRELNERPPREWDGVLKGYSEAYGVEFVVFSLDGRVLAGSVPVIPDKVMVKVREIRAPALPPPRLRPPTSGDRFFPSGAPPGLPPHPPIQPLLPDAPPNDRRPAAFWVRTVDPVKYWVGVGVPIHAGLELPPRIVVLAAVSDSITGNGLFFDPTPWAVFLAAAVLLSALLWFPLVRGMTRSITRMTRATERISQGRFDIRIDEKRSDEIGRLARSINEMAARLDGFVKGQKRFLGDVAHELASPIARMQLSLAILERKLEGRHGPDFKDVLEEVEHMSGLVNELLSFTRAEVNPGKVTLEEVDLRAVAERVVHREKGAMVVRLDLEPGLKAWADPDLLARALANLLRNAARYAGPEGPVGIVGWKLAGRVAVEVRDSGPGVPEAMLTQIFEPFFRPEPSRAREVGGVGLGLSIVKSCVEACQGEVTCRNLKPKGFAVTIFLNLSPRSR